MPKILVVDDEQRIADIIEKYLSMNGFEVIKTTGGEKALEILNSDAKIDMMVLDMKMPKVNGMAVVQKTKELGKNIPILLLTGTFDAEGHFDNLKSTGFSQDDILFKPVDLLVLLEKVKEKLGIA
ncbi:MAG: response regulator [Candidatus Omnitrophota bacterium]